MADLLDSKKRLGHSWTVGGGVMRNSTFLNLVTWKQGCVSASEKQKESGSIGLSKWGQEQG